METYYDYENQAWVQHGVYQCCGHPDSMDCRCYAKQHAGCTPTGGHRRLLWHRPARRPALGRRTA